MPITPEQAGSLSRVAWAALIGAALLAVGVHFLPARVDTRPAPSPGAPPAGETQEERTARFAPAAWRDLEPLMDTLHEYRTGEVAQGPDDQQQPEDDPFDLPPDLAVTSELPGWRFLGRAVVGGVDVAIVSVDNAQRFLRVGDEHNGFTISEVADDFMVARSRTGEHRLQRAARPAPRVMPAIGAAGARNPQDIDPLREQRERERELEAERARPRQQGGGGGGA